MTKTERKRMLCVGCRNDFYNGNSNLGCWNFDDAKIVQRKKIGLWDVPPWTHQPEVKVLSCRDEQGYIFVEPKRTC